MSQVDATQDDKQKLPELAKEKLARVRQHLKDNRKIYYACGATGVVCFFGGKYFRRPIVIDFKPVINNVVAPVINNHVENNLGRISKIVRDVATGEEWQKIRYLAEKISAENGISIDSARVMLNRHFRGELETVFNKTYEIAGLRTEF
jgi:hypothetical protein